MARSTKGIFPSQRKYVFEILEDMGFLGTKPGTFLMKQNLVLSEHDGGLIANPSLCRQLVGKLIYLTIAEPNWSCAMHVLSQFFMDKPHTSHLECSTQSVMIHQVVTKSRSYLISHKQDSITRILWCKLGTMLRHSKIRYKVFYSTWSVTYLMED